MNLYISADFEFRIPRFYSRLLVMQYRVKNVVWIKNGNSIGCNWEATCRKQNMKGSKLHYFWEIKDRRLQTSECLKVKRYESRFILKEIELINQKTLRRSMACSSSPITWDIKLSRTQFPLATPIDIKYKFLGSFASANLIAGKIQDLEGNSFAL